jgi:uncharacterized membrane protein YkvA (DUF1232 family)
MRGLLSDLPQVIRLYARLMANRRVPLLAKLATVLGLLFLLTPCAIELDFIPVIGQRDGLLVGYLSLQLSIWLCPPREHVSGIRGGGVTS